ncbi:MAG: hypothetical protein LBH84_01435 [Prevotellaceae bacterium]|nr:hypothetical protein [Prevotellaceae bacterium]
MFFIIVVKKNSSNANPSVLPVGAALSRVVSGVFGLSLAQRPLSEGVEMAAGGEDEAERLKISPINS